MLSNVDFQDEIVLSCKTMDNSKLKATANVELWLYDDQIKELVNLAMFSADDEKNEKIQAEIINEIDSENLPSFYASINISLDDNSSEPYVEPTIFIDFTDKNGEKYKAFAKIDNETQKSLLPDADSYCQQSLEMSISSALQNTIQEYKKTTKLYERLAISEKAEDRMAAAHNGVALDLLIGDVDPEVRAEVAHQGYGLDKLIKDDSPMVRSIVATKKYGLNVLQKDPSPMVRAEVAYQGYNLKNFIYDPNPTVRIAVAQTAEILGRTDILKEMSSNLYEHDSVVREKVKKALNKLDKANKPENIERD